MRSMAFLTWQVQALFAANGVAHMGGAARPLRVPVASHRRTGHVSSVSRRRPGHVPVVPWLAEGFGPIRAARGASGTASHALSPWAEALAHPVGGEGGTLHGIAGARSARGGGERPSRAGGRSSECWGRGFLNSGKFERGFLNIGKFKEGFLNRENLKI